MTYSVSVGSGEAWLRFSDRAGWLVKAPWNRPLFSERYGYVRPTAKILGFRIFRLEQR